MKVNGKTVTVYRLTALFHFDLRVHTIALHKLYLQWGVITDTLQVFTFKSTKTDKFR